METLSLWRTVSEGFTQRIEAIRPPQWTASTCCEGWDVKKLVGHAIGAQRMVPRALGATGDIDAEGDDLSLVWVSVRRGADAALSVPGVFEQVVKLPFGEMTVQDGIGFPLSDLLVHTWDVARAIGVDDRLLPEACTNALANLEPIDALLRGPGFYGPKIEPTPGADAQDRLLAFLGRRV
jgi:uncharacterized protein (TIGR03086 family)